MTITRRLYTAADQQRIIDFRRTITTPENVSDYPTAVDLYELLEVSLAHDLIRTAFWENESARLFAFAIVDLQYCNCYFQISLTSVANTLKRTL